ncbi:hypothetical protein containing PAS domain [Alteracholeplasma palmae J233]|uniref:GGDEF domain-containing protein n=1 Tax=Alteracholeplasma palmae (strain ATCC 49389 / J233) TaxID=1318466 RepID=U4KLF3_ALTPJ|nr:sensor domain-containing diguanylate cyclase [Alteracholeplasma palmae]CCV64764.1 hypothetical protein containing PAS domain [Alteracholeplasma palmae J233]
MKELNKALVALQNTIIYMGRPLFIIDSNNYEIVCDTPLSRDKLGIYVGMTLQEALGEEVTLSYLKNHVIRNEKNSEFLTFKTVEVLENYYLVMPNLVKEADYLETLASEVFFDEIEAKVILNSTGTIIGCNKKFEEIFGFTNQEIKSKILSNVLDLSLTDKEYINTHKEMFLNGHDICILATRKTKYGNRIKMNIDFVPILNKEEIIGIQVTYKPMNNIADIDLKSYKKIIDNHTDGVIIANDKKQIIYVNKTLCNIFQYHETEFEKMQFFDRALRSFSEQYMADKLEEILYKNDFWQGETWERKRDGSILPAWKQVFVIKDDRNQIIRYVATYKDLSGVTTANMSKMINKDPLTSLNTKQYFINRMESVLQEDPNNQKILFLDIDNFKELNDQNGHLLGDKLLVEISKRMVNHFKKSLKARYAGDEFVIHFSNLISMDKTIEMIDEFKKAMEKPMIIDGKPYIITISTGLAISPNDGVNILELLDRADKKMYFNKNTNRMVIR